MSGQRIGTVPTEDIIDMLIDAAETALATLDQLAIDYEVISCDPELADTQVFCAHYGYPLSSSANVIIAAGKAEPRCYAACVLLATTRLDVNRSVRKRLGVSRASFASAEETHTMTGMEIGGVTPFDLPNDIVIYVDAKVMQLDSVILGSGSRSSKIKVAPSVFEQLLNTEIIEGLSLSPEPG